MASSRTLDGENQAKNLIGFTAAGSIALFGATLSTSAMAEHAPEKGVISYTVVKREAMQIPHNTGQTLTLTQSTGRYAISGGTSPTDGAEVSSVSYSDATKGNGVVHIWTTLTKDGNAVYVKAVGQITTTKGADGKPVTAVSGTYEKIGGTGNYAMLKGAGKFMVKTTSPTTYETHIDGWTEQP